jgi:hypothetical protein
MNKVMQLDICGYRSRLGIRARNPGIAIVDLYVEKRSLAKRHVRFAQMTISVLAEMRIIDAGM